MGRVGVSKRADALYAKLDAALEKARWRRWTLRGIYLNPRDYDAFAKAETRRYRHRTGSKAEVHPLGYRHALIIGGSALPVRAGTKSAVYNQNGEAIYIAALSPKVR